MNVSRYIHRRPGRYVVDLRSSTGMAYANFSDKKYGGKARALLAAKRCRDRHYGVLPARWTHRGPQTNSRTRIQGVCIIKIIKKGRTGKRKRHAIVVAQCTDAGGVVHHKHYFIGRRSREIALLLGKLWRAGKLEEMKRRRS